LEALALYHLKIHMYQGFLLEDVNTDIKCSLDIYDKSEEMHIVETVEKSHMIHLEYDNRFCKCWRPNSQRVDNLFHIINSFVRLWE
jgi:hypothetical protein